MRSAIHHRKGFNMNKNMATSPQRIYDAARYLLLTLVGVTVLNILIDLMGSDTYYVTSVFTAFFVYLFMYTNVGTAIGLLIAAVILVPFVLAFIFSRKKPLWLVVALVLTVLDLCFLVGIGLYYGTLLNSVLDLLAHAFVIIMLILGIVNSKKIMTEVPAAGPEVPAGGAVPQRYADPGAAAPFVDIVCSVGIGNGMLASGVARFYPDSLALGNDSMAATMLIGAVFAPTKEKLRFAYSEIARAYFSKKNERTVQIDLVNGNHAVIVLNNANRENFIRLMNSHGVGIAPFVG